MTEPDLGEYLLIRTLWLGRDLTEDEVSAVRKEHVRDTKEYRLNQKRKGVRNADNSRE